MEEKSKKSKAKRSKKEMPPINSKEYVDLMLKRRKRNTKIAIGVVAFLIVGLAGSTGFALKTMSNTKIIKGISIDGIEVSGMDKESVSKMLEEKVKERKEKTITFKYNDYSKEFSYADINIESQIEKAVDEAISKGRDSNVFINNINVIKSNFKKENIDLDVSYNEEIINELINTINAEIPGKVEDYAYSIEDDKLYISKGKDGIVVDIDTLKNNINNQITDISQNVDATISIPVKNAVAKEIDLDVIYNEIHTEPKDAYIIEEPFQVVSDISGVDFAITMEEAKQLLVENKEEYVIPLKITKAKTTIADLGSKAFPYRLGYFTTRYDAGNLSRTTNLAIATRKINEYVVQPGEVFSYNKVVGKRTVEAGYKEAAIYTSNGVENGLGGGICQISSTLYNAVLKANLEIVERHNHAYVTSYCAAGRDATVSYGALDFKFKNSRKYPIKIVASVGGGVASVSIFGIKEDPEYVVEITSSVTSNTPAPEKRIDDPSLPAGQEVVVKKGTNGCTSVTYKTVYDTNGNRISSQQISSDYYGTIAKEVKVGTGAVATPSVAPVEPSTAPEPPAPTEPVTPSEQPVTPTVEPSTDPEPPTTE